MTVEFANVWVHKGKSQDAPLRKAERLMVAQENAGCPQVHHNLIACSGGRTDN